MKNENDWKKKRKTERGKMCDIGRESKKEGPKRNIDALRGYGYRKS